MESLSKDFSNHQIMFNFFDVEARIHSDSQRYIELFAQMYSRFQAHISSSLQQSCVEFVVRTDPNNPWGKPVMIVDGEVRPLKDRRLLEGFVYESILNKILASVRGYFLAHAGVVSLQGEGIILAADANHGKTTLVLELVRRGFKFLSDEMAALGRADRLVHPYPRSLRIRPGTLELAGFSMGSVSAQKWFDKLLLDIEEIQPGSLGKAVPISQIVILQDPTYHVEERPGNVERELAIILDRMDESLLEAVREIEEMAEAHIEYYAGYPLLRLRSSRRAYVLCKIEELCEEKGILILDVIKKKGTGPTFGTEARLESIPRNQAVMELVRRSLGGHRSAILQDEFGGSAARLFMELAAIIDQANCYQLFVGPLNEMGDLVSELVRPTSFRDNGHIC